MYEVRSYLAANAGPEALVDHNGEYGHKGKRHGEAVPDKGGIGRLPVIVPAKWSAREGEDRRVRIDIRV